MTGGWTEDDVAAMRSALDVAERGRGFTSPNPVVGAVVVADGEIVARGFHERWGGPHAEVSALEAAGERARGAVLYVTLEPCCIWGKTPPCTDAILRAGVSRVVVPVEDPNPEVCGRGLETLRQSGLDVRVGLLREEALRLNAPYFKWQRTGLAHVLLKLALSVDGRIAAPPEGDRWISSDVSRTAGHAMRGAADAVMVGIGTVLADDPLLTDRRDARPERQPSRIVVDSSLRLPCDAALLKGASGPHTIVACGEGANGDAEKRLRDRGAAVWRLPQGRGGVDLRALLRRAASEGLLAVLCEGGRRVATSLLREGLADEVAFFVAPRILGAVGIPALDDLGEDWREGLLALEDIAWSECGPDRLLRARVARRGDAAPGSVSEESECSRVS